MSRIFLPVVLLAALLLTGCGSMGGSSQHFSLNNPLKNSEQAIANRRVAAAVAPPAPGQAAALNKAVYDSFAQDYQRILAHCSSVLSGFEQQSQSAKRFQFVTALVGTVAGAVIVPVLSARQVVAKSAVAGWGGISGAANALQGQFAQAGLDAGTVITDRNSVITELKAKAKDYRTAIAGNNEANAAAALVDMEVACTAYAVSAGKPAVGGDD